MRIAAVDDDRVMLEQLVALCEEFADARSLSMSVETFDSAGALLKALGPKAYDLVFLDIYMEPMNGITLARELRRRHHDLCIVFLTTSSDFMPDAFSIHAFQYILKPYSRQQLFTVLEDALRTLPQREGRLDIMCAGTLEHLRIADIISAVSDAHYLQVDTANGEVYRTRMTLTDFLLAVKEEPAFLQINKGIVINMNYVDSVDSQSCLMETGAQYPIKVRDRVQIERQIRAFIFGNLRKSQ